MRHRRLVGPMMAITLTALSGCASTSPGRLSVDPKTRTVTAIGDRPIAVSTGEPGERQIANASVLPVEEIDRELAGRVVDAEGLPVSDVEVRIAVDGRSSGRSRTVWSDAAGRFTFQDLRTGSDYTLIAEVPDGQGGYLTGRVRTRVPERGLEIALAAPDEAPGRRISQASSRANPQDDWLADPAVPASGRGQDEDFPLPRQAEDLLAGAGGAGGSDDDLLWRRSDDVLEVGPGQMRTPSAARAGEPMGGNPLPPARERLIDEPIQEPIIPDTPPRRPEMAANPDVFEGVPAAPIVPRTGGSDDSTHDESLIEKALAGEAATPAPEIPPVRVTPLQEPDFPGTGPDPAPAAAAPVEPTAPSIADPVPFGLEEVAPAPMVEPIDAGVSADSDPIPPTFPALNDPAPEAPAEPVFSPSEIVPDPFDAPMPGVGPADPPLVPTSPDAAAPMSLEPPSMDDEAPPLTEAAPGPPPMDASLAQTPADPAAPSPLNWGQMDAVATLGSGLVEAKTIQDPAIIPASAETVRSTSVSDPYATSLASARPSASAASRKGTLPPAEGLPLETVKATCRLDARKHRVLDFQLTSLQGKPIEFKQLDSDLVLLDFWGTWCGPCLDSIPRLVELQDQFGPERLQIVGIAYEEGAIADRAAIVRETSTRLGVNYPLAIAGADGKPCPLRESLNVKAFPTLILLDRQGNILWRDQGNDPKSLARLERVIQTNVKLAAGARPLARR